MESSIGIISLGQTELVSQVTAAQQLYRHKRAPNFAQLVQACNAARQQKEQGHCCCATQASGKIKHSNLAPKVPLTPDSQYCCTVHSYARMNLQAERVL
jgi:hypothetical protein